MQQHTIPHQLLHDFAFLLAPPLKTSLPARACSTAAHTTFFQLLSAWWPATCWALRVSIKVRSSATDHFAFLGGPFSFFIVVMVEKDVVMVLRACSRDNEDLKLKYVELLSMTSCRTPAKDFNPHLQVNVMTISSHNIWQSGEMNP